MGKRKEKIGNRKEKRENRKAEGPPGFWREDKGNHG
jgi:hypothetical protein